MKVSKKAMMAAVRIAERAGVSVDKVLEAYRSAASGSPVNRKSLYLA